MEKRGIKKPPVGAKIRLALASASRRKKKKKDGGKPLRVDRSLRKGQTSRKKFFFFNIIQRTQFTFGDERPEQKELFRQLNL